MRTFLLVSILAAGLGFAAEADVIISDFDNFNIDGTFNSWDTANLISGPTGYTVQSTGFGGGFENISPNIDASGETAVELDITVNQDTSPTVVVVLQDADGTVHNFRWFGLPLGNNVVTAPVTPVPGSGPGYDTFESNPGSTPGLDTSDLDFFQLQVDDSDAYDVTFNNLAMVPEPSSLALLALGGFLAALRRRR